jgi:hypothetical protein
MNQLAALAPGKKLSIKNLARKGAKPATRKPAAPPADCGDHEYR